MSAETQNPQIVDAEVVRSETFAPGPAGSELATLNPIQATVIESPVAGAESRPSFDADVVGANGQVEAMRPGVIPQGDLRPDGGAMSTPRGYDPTGSPYAAHLTPRSAEELLAEYAANPFGSTSGQALGAASLHGVGVVRGDIGEI